jgi:hypothetical protein
MNLTNEYLMGRFLNGVVSVVDGFMGTVPTSRPNMLLVTEIQHNETIKKMREPTTPSHPHYHWIPLSLQIPLTENLLSQPHASLGLTSVGGSDSSAGLTQPQLCPQAYLS